MDQLLEGFPTGQQPTQNVGEGVPTQETGQANPGNSIFTDEQFGSMFDDSQKAQFGTSNAEGEPTAEQQPDFVQAYRELQSKKDKEIAEYQRRLQQLESQYGATSDAMALAEYINSDPQLANTVYSTIQSHMNGTAAEPEAAAPEAPDPEQYAFDDPDEMKRWTKDVTTYQRDLAEFNKKVLQQEIAANVNPYREYVEAQRQAQEEDQVRRQVFQHAVQRGLSQQEAAEMVQIFSQKQNMTPDDLVLLYRAMKGQQQQTVSPPSQPQQNPALHQLAKQRALQQQFPAPPQTTQRAVIDPVAAMKDQVVSIANERLVPRLK